MAETERDERTEQPTQKRLDEARKKGQIPRSRELNGTAVLLAGAGSIYALGGWLSKQFSALVSSGLTVDRAHATDVNLLIPQLGAGLAQAGKILAPILLLTFVVALAAPALIGGFSFSTEALAPKFSKLNPIQGFGRIFSARGLVELLKTMAKFLFVGLIAAGMLWHLEPRLMALGNESLESALGDTGSMCIKAMLAMSSGLVLIAAIDVPFQLWDHRRQLRMTKQEVKDEMRDTEGKPEVKGKIRSLQQEIASRRMMEEVPKADVIVTNPTHFAVALRYDEARMRAPRVVAKGADVIAARIREVAAEHKVPLVEAPPLARALYRNTDLGQEIPASLYRAVAQVLTYVYQLRHGVAPAEPPEIDVDEFGV